MTDIFDALAGDWPGGPGDTSGPAGADGGAHPEPGAGAAPGGADGFGAGAGGIGAGSGGGMLVRLGDAVLDLGPVDAEPGVADSVTLADDDGLTIYTDTDGDGTVDEIVTVRFDGTWESWDTSDAPTDGGGAGRAAGSWGAADWELRESGTWG
ncbi:DUF6802 family protein [Corynebacterium sp. 335C]